MTTTWLDGAVSESLRETMERESFHILHIVARGSVDPSGEVFVFLAGEARPEWLSSAALARLIADGGPRLVVLEIGGETDDQELSAGLATTLIHAGIPAVITAPPWASQVSGPFFKRFYEAVTLGRPVDDAVLAARREVFSRTRVVECLAPVLHLGLPHGRLFDLRRLHRRPPEGPQEA